MSRNVLGVIPARLASTRLPRKPLHPLLGRPLIEWVWRRVEAMEVLDRVVVATDSTEVADVVQTAGGVAELTDPDHPSGTDRVWEVAGREAYAGFDVVVNVQGDEPLVEEAHVRAASELVAEGGWDLATCAAPLGSAEALKDPNVVKVVRGASGGALYFSRAAVPHARDREPSPEELAGGPFLRHLGLYAYRRDALARWVGLEPSGLELLERLEQLRPLEAGMAMGVAVVDEAAPGVDTPEDAAKMEERLSGILEPPFVPTGR